MQKVWFRKQTSWWCASIREGGTYRQIKLLKAPDDKAGRKLAEAQLVQELAAKQPTDESDSVPGWMTVARILNAFLKHSQGEHEPATARWYADLIRPFRDLWGKVRVTQLRKKHVKRWLEAKGYNPTSANRALGAVKRAFNWAVEEEHISKNPIAHVRKPKSLTRDRTLTPEERELILGSIKCKAFRQFVDAMTLTGCRPGNSLG